MRNSKQKQNLRRHEMKKKNMIWLMVLSLCLIGVANTSAATWDLGDDWVTGQPLGSGGANPNGQWSYGHSTELTQASFVLNAAYEEWNTPANAGVWWTASGTWSLVWHSFGVTDANGDINPGDNVVQTGVNNAVTSVIRWTSPLTGYVEASVYIESGYGASTAAILHNDEVLTTLPAGTQSASGILSVTAGDTLDVVIIPPDLNSHMIKLDITITDEVTEPTEPVKCILQLDAAHGLTDPNGGTDYGDGDVVGRWQDTQSGNTMEAFLAWGDPTLETNEINGQNVIRFTGDDGLVIDPNSDPDDLLNADYYTMFVVGRINDLTLSQIFYANYSDPPAGVAVGISDSQFNTIKYYANRGGTLSPDDELIQERFYLFTATCNWKGERTLSINGEVVKTSYLGGSTYNANTVASIGALDIGRQFLVGDIAEIRVYNGFDAGLHDTVTADLIAKYNIDTTPVVPDPDVISLTAMTLTRTGSTGGMITNLDRYNTIFEDAAWDMAVYEGNLVTNPALYDPNNPDGFWLNNLKYMMIDIPLRLGDDRTFNWHCAYSSPDVPKMGMNLFFDDSQNQDIPGLSVYAQMDATGPGDGTPEFLANSATSTMGWPITSVPGTGSLIYYDTVKKMKVTLTDFVVYHPDVYNLDFIGAQVQDPNSGINPVLGGNDGVADLIGRFTLKVETLDCSTLDHFAADFNKDCRVDLDDFAQLIATWLQCNDPRNPDGCPNP